MVQELEKPLGSPTEAGHSPESALNLLRQQTIDLASNFYPGPATTQIRKVLDSLTGGSDNPWLTLQEMPDEELLARVSLNGFRQTIQDLYSEYVDYLLSKNTWFERTSALSFEEKEYLKKHPIASFSLEIALGKSPQTYSGGLGVLNGDVAREESDMDLPVDYVSLLYSHGYFIQRIDRDGWQGEDYCNQNGNQYPMRDMSQEIGLIKVPMGDHDIFAKTWEATLGRRKVYLLDTNVEENKKEEDRLITGYLYGKGNNGNDNNETRMKQEIVLGVGGVRLLQALGKEPSIYHLQEGHAAFAALEATASLVEKGMPLDKACWYVQNRTAFTNHTTVAQDFFSKELIDYYLKPLAKRMSTPTREISTDELYSLGEDLWGFSMTRLALKLSAKKNGVSKLHTQVLHQYYPEEKTESITNGIHIETWLAEPMQILFDKYLGPTWHDYTGLDDTLAFDKIYGIPDEKLWEAKLEQKGRMIAYLNNKYGCNLSSDYLTLGIARRFAEYKRNNLPFYDMNQLAQILADEECPVQFIIGGKAHPWDNPSKEMIANINKETKGPRLENKKGKVVFISEYDMELAKWLVGGVDLWLNVPRIGQEACGTSGMKAGINGTLSLTTRDGWADEVDWSDRGWAIGEEDDIGRQTDQKDASELYRLLRDEIIPTYYGSRKEWIKKMKNTMVEILANFTTRRMVREQTKILYHPILKDIVGEELKKTA